MIGECKVCRDTGKTHLSTNAAGERVHSEYLDCGAAGCTAAVDRANLAAEFPHICKDWPDTAWLIFLLGRKREREGRYG